MVPLSADEDHGARGLDETGLVDAVALFLFHDNRADVGDQIVVRGSLTQQGPQIVVLLAKQAGAELAIGGEPDARAMATERLGHRRDQTDFARCALGEAIFAGGLAALMGNFVERPAGVDALVDLRRGAAPDARSRAGGAPPRVF